MENRHPRDLLWSWVSSDLLSLRSSGSLKSPEVEIFAFFFGMIKFSKFCSQSLHCDTDRHYCVQNSWKLSNGKSVKSCVIYLTKTNKISALSQTVVTLWIAPKVCQGQPPTFGSHRSKFHPNRLTFGRVIAERVNTVKTRRKVNPIFGWSLASSRIMMLHDINCRQCEKPNPNPFNYLPMYQDLQ